MKMSTQSSHNLQEYLRRLDVQERIEKSIQQARSNVTVTISKAADLFDFTESRLREWEKKGLLTTDRNTLEGKEGHRRYTSNELSKLAVLQELFNNGGYTPSDIPKDYDEIWERIATHKRQNHTAESSGTIVDVTYAPDLATKDNKHIDQRVQHAEQEVFWRYFTSQVLRLSLMLICEDIPDTVAGLILPLEPDAAFISDPIDLPNLNEALIGWLNQNGSFNTFLDASPSFEHPSDFRIEPLLANGEEESCSDKTMIIVQRKANPLNLSLSLVQTVRRLLNQVYNNVSKWHSAYNYGLRDYLYQATDFNSSTNPWDVTLNKLMESIIHIGGKSSNDHARDRWWFCFLMLPVDASLSLQKRSLIIRAQSASSPYKIGTKVSNETPGLSLRAYQSGNIIYRPDVSAKDTSIAYQEQEQSTRSAIAIPIIREDGLSMATLYIASEEPEAFLIEDQRMLRLIGIMIEELLLTYQARQQISWKRSELLDHPGIVDPSFKNFLTENDFIHDLETLLISIQNSNTEERVFSLIAIDIDNQSELAAQFGDRVARNLSKEVGTRLRNYLHLFTDPNHRWLYHINADRYYLLLDGVELDEARNIAEQARNTLKDTYWIYAQRFSNEKSKLLSTKLELPNVTVRFGVLSYTSKKIKEVLKRYDAETTIIEVRSIITDALNIVLDKGRSEGGDVIISWDYNEWSYKKWTPTH